MGISTNYVMYVPKHRRIVTLFNTLVPSNQGEEWPDDLASFLREHAPRIDVEDGSKLSLANIVFHIFIEYY